VSSGSSKGFDLEDAGKAAKYMAMLLYGPGAQVTAVWDHEKSDVLEMKVEVFGQARPPREPTTKI